MSQPNRLERRLRQQEVVAELGHQGLQTTNLDQLIQDACVAVADTLDAEYSTVLKLDPNGEEAFLTHGRGWRDGLVGSASVPTDPNSQVGYTLFTEEPVIVRDLRKESRFASPELFSSHDVVSGISVVIGSVDQPWGVLGVHTSEQRHFTDYDAAFIQSIANVLASTIERNERETELDRTIDLLEHTERVADVGGWELTADDMELYWSDHLYEVLEVTDDFEPHIETVIDAVHNADRDRFIRALETALQDGKSFAVEVRVFTQDGDIKWLHIRGIADVENGEVIRIRGAAQDITERREREGILEQAQQRIELALEATDATVWEWDPETDTITTIPDPHGLLGTFVETSGDFLQAVHPDDRDRVEAAWLDGIESDDPYHVDFRYLRNGSVRWAEDYGEIFPVDDEGTTRMLGVVYDITERKEHQKQLEQSERRYRALVDNFPNGAVALFDHDLEYIAAGGELIEELGIDDPVGEHVFEQCASNAVAEIEPNVRAALSGEHREFEIEYLGRYLLARTLPIQSKSGDVQAGMLVVLDITEEQESKRRLEESHQRLEEFATAVSHDLREPLGTVASYLQLLERRYEEELDDDAREFVDFAVSGATRMREMIDGLVTTYARVDKEGDPFDPVDLQAVLEDVERDLAKKIETNDAEITAGSLPSVTGDYGQLEQVLMNLIDNAIKYSGEEPPQIHISAKRDDSMWEVSVHDEGIGLEPEKTENVFKVFTRLHSKEDYPGTGIGLALCDRIIERHGGEIWVESEPGEGSTFSFTVPAVSY